MELFPLIILSMKHNQTNIDDNTYMIYTCHITPYFIKYMYNRCIYIYIRSYLYIHYIIIHICIQRRKRSWVWSATLVHPCGSHQPMGALAWLLSMLLPSSSPWFIRTFRYFQCFYHFPCSSGSYLVLRSFRENSDPNSNSNTKKPSNIQETPNSMSSGWYSLGTIFISCDLARG